MNLDNFNPLEMYPGMSDITRQWVVNPAVQHIDPSIIKNAA